MSFRFLPGHRATGLLLCILLAASSGFAQPQAKLPFMDPNLTFEQRVEDLVSRLTLEEKIGQMLNSAPAIERLGIPAYDWWNEVLHGVALPAMHIQCLALLLLRWLHL